MKGIKELSQEILEAWALGANITLPDKETRVPWLPAVADLAKMVQKQEITVEDVYQYTREICSEPWKRRTPQFWSIKYIRDHIWAWKEVSEKKKYIPPPPGWESHVDHLGFSYSWDWKNGKEVVVERQDRVKPEQTSTHSPGYVPLAPNERMVKRIGREGYQRDFFLTGIDSELSEEEERQLEELARDDLSAW